MRLTSWLAICVIGAGLPHTATLPAWISMLAIAIIVSKFWCIKQQYQLGSLVKGFIAVSIASGVFVYYGTLLGRDAGIGFLVIMTALKFLETKDSRDAAVVVYLTWFLIAAFFLFSQNMLVFSFMLLVGLSALVTLSLIAAPRSKISTIDRFQISGNIALQALPLMIIMFLVFPRISGPLWGIGNEAKSGRSGLSDSLQMGQISNLVRDPEVAFRVHFDAAAPPSKDLYWRGPVLSLFKKNTWTAAAASTEQHPALTNMRRATRYAISLEPHGKRWLFALDTPASVPPRAKLNSDYQLLNDKAVIALKRYNQLSYLEVGRATLGLGEYQRQQNLQLPRDLNPRSQRLAQQWQNEFTTSAEIVDAALQYFYREDFVYTLSPGTALGQHSVDEFLFETRRGFCEYFAASFVTLMRYAGVPARIVTGYQGGEWSLAGDYMIVRQSDAHAWAEVWLPNQGWLRVDPTAAVAPARIETGIEAVLGTDRSHLPLFVRQNKDSIIKQFGLAWDSVHNFWNEWVLGYGPELQARLLAMFGADTTQWTAILLVAIVLAAVFLAALMAWVLRHHSAARPGPIERSYARFCRKLGRLGLPRLPGEGPMDYANRVSVALAPNHVHRVQHISALYIALQYRSTVTAENLSRLAAAVRRFNPKLRSAATPRWWR